MALDISIIGTNRCAAILENTSSYKTPQLPIEIWELIIDCVHYYDQTRRETLYTCCLVCWGWHARAKAHLYKKFTLDCGSLPSLDMALRNNPHLCTEIAAITVTKQQISNQVSDTRSIAFFAIRHRFPKLLSLQMDGLDLAREHQWLYKAPLFRTVQRLSLRQLKTCQLSQLIRFINYFPSLSNLRIRFALRKLDHKGQILPRPLAVTRALRFLQLDLKPGVSGLLNWLIKATPLLAQLETLVLFVWGIIQDDTFRSSFEGVDRLLDHCSSSIKELKLYLSNAPMIEDVSDLIKLDSLPKLEHLTYGSFANFHGLLYASRQLGLLATRCNLISITLDLVGQAESQSKENICGSLDSLVATDLFPSLKDVFINKAVPFQLFPKLNARRLLRVLPKGFWVNRTPIQLYNLIIDWIYYEWVQPQWDWETRKTLVVCSFVSQAWRDRAQEHLRKSITTCYKDLPSFGLSSQRESYVSRSITSITVKRPGTGIISPFAIQNHLPNLSNIYIHYLDLAREHRWLTRAPIFRSVRVLWLIHLQSCQLSQLIRFINSFPILEELEITFSFKELEYKGQFIPKPCHANTRHLTRLLLDLKPGVSRLIQWLLIADPLLAKLKRLSLYLGGTQDEADHRSRFMGLERLLDRCHSSIMDLRLYLKWVPTVLNSIRLDSFPNLKYLTYGSSCEFSLIPCATQQLGAMTRKCNLVQISFDISLDHLERGHGRDVLKQLDNLLSGDGFSSLQDVKLHKTISCYLFPRLHLASKLKHLETSFWKDYPLSVQRYALTVLCNLIIDWIYHDWIQSKWDWETRKTLVMCSFVSRAWRDRAQGHLSKSITTYYKDLPSFGLSLQRESHVSLSITSITVMGPGTGIISPFAIQNRLPNLSNINICYLDLAQEHRWLTRAPIFRSVRFLYLFRLQSCQLSQLIQFINSFPILEELETLFSFKTLEYEGQSIPRPCHANTRHLTYLQLDLKPGVSRLIHWLLIADSLLARLKTLSLCVYDSQDEPDFRSSFHGVERLLHHCGSTIVDFRVYIKRVPLSGYIPDLIRLDSLPHLKYLTYGSAYKDFVLRYASQQIAAATSMRNLIWITFDINLDTNKYYLDKKSCEMIDKFLCRDGLSFHPTVFLYQTLSFESFPELKKAGRLGTVNNSFWRSRPLKDDDDLDRDEELEVCKHTDRNGIR